MHNRHDARHAGKNMLFIIIIVSSLAGFGITAEEGITPARILLISDTVQQASVLAEAAGHGTLGVIIETGRDQPDDILAKIDEAADGRPIASIALAAHDWGDGVFYLTSHYSVSLNSLKAPELRAFLSELGKRIVEGGSLDILTCNLIANETGRRLVKQLEELTQRRVSASVDATGNLFAGGNWVLENTGVDAAGLYFNEHAIQEYSGLLLITEDVKLTAAGLDTGDRFGESVDVDGYYAIVSARGDDGPANATTASGVAYIFFRDQGGAGNWGLQKTVRPASLTTFSEFGSSDDDEGVSISGDTAVIGLRSFNSFSGKVFILYRNQGGSNNWGIAKELTNPASNPTDVFGGNVQIEGDILIVAAPRSDESGFDSDGVVYIFYRNQGGADNWGLVKKLDQGSNRSGSNFDQFGSSIDYDPATGLLAVSADEWGADDRGRTYLFGKDHLGNDNWGLITILTYSGLSAGDFFGTSVAVDGTVVAVGAEDEDVSPGDDAGAILLFEKDAGGTDNWGHTKTFNHPDGDVSFQWGLKVELTGNILLISDSDKNGTQGGNAGVVFRYARNQGGTNNWGLADSYEATDIGDADEFGASMATDEATIIIGAFRADAEDGSAYLFFEENPPTVSQPTDTSVAHTTATLGGTVDSAGSNAVIERGVVVSTFADPSLTNYDHKFTTAGTTGVFTVSATGLTPGQAYHYRAFARSASGTGYSLDATFTTLNTTAPSIDTPTATSIGNTSATLGGTVQSDGGQAITERGVVVSTSSNPTTASNDFQFTSAGTTGIFTVNATGLAAGTTYHYRAYATNSVGTSYTTDQTFMTTAFTAPVINTPTATNITFTSATLGGTVQGDGGQMITERGVVVSTSSNPTTASNDFQFTSAGTTGTFTVNATGLAAGTTYHYRAYAINSQGTSYTSDQTFETDAFTAPVIDTPTSASVSYESATLGATVQDEGNSTITQRGVVVSTTADPTISSHDFLFTAVGTTGVFTVNATGLMAGTTYHFRGFATNTGGTSYTSDATFTTEAFTPPTIDSPTAASITYTSATLGATVQDDGGKAVTERGVVIGSSADPTTASNLFRLTQAGTTGIFTVFAAGLTQGTTYHYRGYATNSEGTSYTADMTFTTDAFTAPNVSNPTDSNIQTFSAVLGAEVNDDGGDTITERGVVISMSANPTLASNDFSFTTPGTTGVFTVTATGLLENTMYYYRGFATNSTGTGYTSNGTFTTDSLKILTVTFTGSGSGTVVSDKGSINASRDGASTTGQSSDSYETGTDVVLTATPEPGSSFSSWSGDATGTSTQVSLTVDADKNVEATFTRDTGTVEVILVDAPPGGGWNFSSTPSDYSGVTSGNSDFSTAGAPTGTYEISATAVPGYDVTITPASTMDLSSNGTITFTITYSVSQGSIRAILNPSGIRSQATWSILGRSETHSHGTVHGFPQGSYIVQFNAIEGYVRPADQVVKVEPGQTTDLVATWSPATEDLPVIHYFTSTPESIAMDGSTVLNWFVRNASSVQIDGLATDLDSNGNMTVQPTALPESYVLTAANAAGRVTASVVVGAASAPEILYFMRSGANPAHPDSETMLSWGATGGASATLSEQGSRQAANTTSVDTKAGSIIVRPSRDTTYTLEVKNAQGSTVSEVEVNVERVPAIMQFTAIPRAVVPGQSVEFIWTIAGNISSLFIDPAIDEPVAGNAGRAEHLVTESNDYTLTATNNSGSTSMETSIELVDPERATDLHVTIEGIMEDSGSARSNLRAARAGMPLLVEATVENNGARRARNITVALYKDGQPVANTIVRRIRAGSSQTVRMPYIPTSPGKKRIAVSADPLGLIADTERENNIDEQTFRVRKVTPVELVISNVETRLIESDIVLITYTIVNAGREDAGPFQHSLSVSGTRPPVTSSILINREIADGLASGESIRAQAALRLDASMIKRFNLQVVADTQQAIIERSKNNNQQRLSVRVKDLK